MSKPTVGWNTWCPINFLTLSLICSTHVRLKGSIFCSFLSSFWTTGKMFVQSIALFQVCSFCFSPVSKSVCGQTFSYRQWSNLECLYWLVVDFNCRMWFLQGYSQVIFTQLTEFNSKFDPTTHNAKPAILSAFSSVVGNLFSSDHHQVNSDLSKGFTRKTCLNHINTALLAFNEVVLLNRNFLFLLITVSIFWRSFHILWNFIRLPMQRNQCQK